ncbi:DNA-binding transcriptional LysR family regulator [Mycolicibacterium mucogenicum 261Sha1.1M5]|nr:DNA-binding transcriptional LysR family regulator [Mycolicibacterium mucogenicum 261Sha1.1M5]
MTTPEPVRYSPHPELPLRELEYFAVVNETLHFGQAAEKLGVTPGRVSQMIGRLEQRIGGQLFLRTSRRVELSDLGSGLAARVVPSLLSLRAAFDAAQAAALSPARPLRVGFQCSVYEAVARVVAAMPQGMVQLVELPWSDPLTGVTAGAVDLALVLSPAEAEGLRTWFEFSPQDQVVGIARTSALAQQAERAGRTSVSAAELATLTLIGPANEAPAAWLAANAPVSTPDGTALSYGPRVRTLPEALSLAATGAGGVLLCEASAAYLPRPDLRYLLVEGVPQSSLSAVTNVAATPHPLLGEFLRRLHAATSG